MRIQNNGPKAIIVKPESVTEGGERRTNGNSDLLYINPGDSVEIEEAVGKKIVQGYPGVTVVDRSRKKT